MISIVNEDCIDFMCRQCDMKYDVVFADPPDNIGLDYQGHQDKMSPEEYESFLVEFISHGMAVVNNGMWISFNSRHLTTVAIAIDMAWPLLDCPWVVTPCVQTITFGSQKNKPGKLTNNYRPLWYISHGEPNFNEVREPSWRQLNGDKRADPRGKLVSDVFDFPRVTGNSKQRRKWHPTQLNEKLIERCLLLTTQEGDHVLDIFAGTGTTGRVCRSIGRKCTLVEKSAYYCQKMREELIDGKSAEDCGASNDQDADYGDGCNDCACARQA